MIGELNFFLGFQIKQLKEGTFIHQEKYTNDILKKFKMDDCKSIKTPIPTNAHLHLDEGGKSADQKLYRSMIGSLLYLTASRPDIMFSVCMCARFEANPKESHLSALKRILDTYNTHLALACGTPMVLVLSSWVIRIRTLPDVE
jgi:hypothetical protein